MLLQLWGNGLRGESNPSDLALKQQRVQVLFAENLPQLRIESQAENEPPRKWEVYEQILRIPYYVVFSRYTNQLRAFRMDGAHYQEIELQEPRVWMPELELGLGLWQGEYQGIERLWLRWYDAQGNWILTEAEQERQRAEQAESRLESLIQRLRESGIDPDTFLNDQS